MSTFWLRVRDWLAGTYTLAILENAWDLLAKVGPALLASLVIGVIASRLLRNRPLLFSGRGALVSIVLASGAGLVSPLPTYAAIPVALTLMSGGVPFCAVLAFAISSPLMNPSIFFLTTTELGLEMALARTVTAFLLGMTAGLCALALAPSLFPPRPAMEQAARRHDRPLMAEILGSIRYAAKYFSVAILLSAAVKALVPAQAVLTLVGADARAGTLIAMGLGVPFYSCGGAAIPFAETLMGLGMGKGPLLAFFIAGPATKLETLYAFKSLLGLRVLLFYLAITCAFAFAAGIVYSFL